MLKLLFASVLLLMTGLAVAQQTDRPHIGVQPTDHLSEFSTVSAHPRLLLAPEAASQYFS